MNVSDEEGSEWMKDSSSYRIRRRIILISSGRWSLADDSRSERVKGVGEAEAGLQCNRRRLIHLWHWHHFLFRLLLEGRPGISINNLIGDPGGAPKPNDGWITTKVSCHNRSRSFSGFLSFVHFHLPCQIRFHWSLRWVENGKMTPLSLEYQDTKWGDECSLSDHFTATWRITLINQLTDEEYYRRRMVLMMIVMIFPINHYSSTQFYYYLLAVVIHYLVGWY